MSIADFSDRTFLCVSVEKRLRHFVGWTTTLCLLLATPRPALPQPPSPASTSVAEADRLFEKLGPLNQEGRYDEALELTLRVLPVYQRAFGENHPKTAITLSSLAFLQSTRGEFDKAIETYRRVLAIYEKNVGADHQGTLSVANFLAICYLRQGENQNAKLLFERVLRGREVQLGPNHQSCAEVLNNLALVHADQAEYAKAKSLYERALNIHKTSDPASLGVATSLDNLAALHLKQGQLDKAESLFRTALNIRQQKLGNEHPAFAVSLNNLGQLFSRRGDLKNAATHFERAIAIQEVRRGENPADIATTFDNLGGVYLKQGAYGAARTALEKARSIREQTVGREHRDFAMSLNNLALLHSDLGDYSTAASLYKESVEIKEKLYGPEHPDVATSINNLANIYLRIGQVELAEQQFQRALDIRVKVFGAQSVHTAEIISNLAVMYNAVGKNHAVERMFESVLKIQRKELGEAHPATLTTMNNLALTHLALDDFEKAQSELEQVYELQKNALGLEHPDTAVSINNLAETCRRRGNHKKAETLFEQAVQLGQKLLGDSHPATSLRQQSLGTTYLQIGKLNEAIKTIDASRRGTSQHVARILPSLTQEEQKLYLQHQYSDGLSAALSVGLQNSSDITCVEMSASWLTNGKAVSQSAMAVRQLLMRDLTDPNLAPLVVELSETRTRLANLAMSVGRLEDADARRETIEHLTAKEHDLTRKLANATGTSQPTATWIDQQQVRDALPERTALIDIVRLREYDFLAERGQQWKAATYVAWITSRSENVRIVNLGPADQIDNLIQTVRTGLQAAVQPGGVLKTDGEDSATAAIKKELRALAERVWRPLAPHLNNVDRLILCPDGSLWLTPWSALPVTESSEYLIEKYHIRYVTSGRDLIQRPATIQAHAPVMLANPQFDQQPEEKKASIREIFKELPEDTGTATRSFTAKNALPEVTPLPSTGIEAVATQPNIERYTGQKATLYQKDYALEKVAKALRRPSVVSFATHGFFLPTPEIEPDDSRNLQTASVDETRTATLSQAENPLLRCGLLLAGCNNRDAAIADDDGVLTGQEIVGVDFRGTELVVLSACETGLGDLRNGEGVAGLRQAFQLAGAEAVVSTLWQVPDRDSALLMQKFFSDLADGCTKADALRNAQLARIERRRNRSGAAHPFFWAAWTVTGIGNE